MKYLASFVALLFATFSSLHPQDIAGSWQATAGDAKEHHRMVLEIDKQQDGDPRAVLYLVDDTPNGFAIPSLSRNGFHIAFDVPELKLSYKGTLSSDSRSISGEMVWDGEGNVTFKRATASAAWPHDAYCACKISFVPVAKGVKLEVLDWGGNGRPLILLAGLGGTAHVFDTFAQKLTARYHVYGITRRGFGESTPSPPTEANYNADRLGEDVAAVVDSLHLRQRPVLVGHSVAGEELSFVGSQYPDKVAGLIYLDAAYGYAFYNTAFPNYDIDALSIRKQLEATILSDDTEKAISDLLASLPEFEKKLRDQQRVWFGVPATPSGPNDFGPAEAIKFGQRKYTQIKVPVLAVFASPHKLQRMPGASDAEFAAMEGALQHVTDAGIKALSAGLPSAKIVVIPNADHNIFKSNEADVLREMDSFLATLPPASAPHAQSAGP